MNSGKKIKDLFDKYINETNNEIFFFVYNSKKIERNDQRKIKEIFKNGDFFTLMVFD